MTSALWLSCLALVAPASTLKFSGMSSNLGVNEYYWPSARGKPGRYGISEHSAPSNFSTSLAWSWHHPGGRFHTVLFGTALDDKSNVYLTCSEGLRKLSPNGEVIWEYKRGDPGYDLKGEITSSASLYDGMIYSSTTACELFGLDMQTGKQIWKTQTSKQCGGDSGFTSASDGVVIAAGDASSENFKWTVKGFNAKDGSSKWTYITEGPTWTFSPNFAGDGTFTFQDSWGGVYRLKTQDGTSLWTHGGVKGSWTDGQSLLGYNGIVYAVRNPKNGGGANGHGFFCAHRLSDGEELWCNETPRPPNGVASLGRVAGHDRLAVVQPIGQQCEQGAPTDIYAYDAETGKQLWVFNGPTQAGRYQRAEEEGFLERTISGVRSMTLPHPWSAPTIDAAGTVFIGSEEGGLYALRDENGDGIVSGESEVSSMDAKACFHGDTAPAISPDLMAVATTDTLYVFKNKAS